MQKKKELTFRMNKEDLLFEAVRDGWLPDVEKGLMGCHVDCTDINGNTALHIAIDNGHSDIIQFLLEKGANVNAKKTTGYAPLHMAVYSGQLDLIKDLIAKNADIQAVTNEGNTALHIAASYDYVEIAQHLVNKGIEVLKENEFGQDALAVAIEQNSSSVVSFLSYYYQSKAEQEQLDLVIGCDIEKQNGVEF